MTQCMRQFSHFSKPHFISPVEDIHGRVVTSKVKLLHVEVRDVVIYKLLTQQGSFVSPITLVGPSSKLAVNTNKFI